MSPRYEFVFRGAGLSVITSLSMARSDRFIRASEVGEYLYCARAWWLRRQGFEPKDGGRFEAGRRWHEEHGAGVVRARRLRRVARASLFAALAVAAVALLVWWSS